MKRNIVEVYRDFASHFELIRDCRLELAKAVQHCCIAYPDSVSLPISGHVLKWITAEHRSQNNRTGEFEYRPRRVLILDGKLVDEPSIGFSVNGDVVQNCEAIYMGSPGRWYEGGIWKGLEWIHAQLKANGMEVKEPIPYSPCDIDALRSIVGHLPKIMTIWYVLNMPIQNPEELFEGTSRETLHETLSS